MTSNPERPEYIRRTARFIAETGLEHVSPAARERGRWIIADCIPVIAAGMAVPEMREFVARHLENSSTGNAWVIGTGLRSNPLEQAGIERDADTAAVTLKQRFGCAVC